MPLYFFMLSPDCSRYCNSSTFSVREITTDIRCIEKTAVRHRLHTKLVLIIQICITPHGIIAFIGCLVRRHNGDRASGNLNKHSAYCFTFYRLQYPAFLFFSFRYTVTGIQMRIIYHAI